MRAHNYRREGIAIVSRLHDCRSSLTTRSTSCRVTPRFRGSRATRARPCVTPLQAMTAPDALKCVLLDCLNAILRGDSPSRSSLLGGLVCLLFMKGDASSLSCYRPVCLLDKILQDSVSDRDHCIVIVTDRLYRLT